MSPDYRGRGKSGGKPRGASKSSGGVEYETLAMKEVEFGDNGFIEIAKKVRKDGKEESVFYTVARGFYGSEDGARIVMGNKPNNQCIIPAQDGVAAEVADALWSLTPDAEEEE